MGGRGGLSNVGRLRSGRSDGAPPGSDRAGLDEEDEGRGAQPGEQRELDRTRVAQRPDEHDVDDQSEDGGGHGLEEAEGDLEYADEVTVSRALEGRRAIS